MKTVKISGMTCSMCVKHVTEAIASVPGVSNVQVSLEEGRATFEAGDSSVPAVIEAVVEEGYEATEV